VPKIGIQPVLSSLSLPLGILPRQGARPICPAIRVITYGMLMIIATL
jgi:hypothetical protein